MQRVDADQGGPIGATLREPGVRRVLATSLLARLPLAALTLLLVLRSRELGGSYATSGAVVTAYANRVGGHGAPLIAKLADRRGQTIVLAVGIPINVALDDQRPAAAVARRLGSGRDQSTAVQRAKRDVERALGELEVRGQLCRGGGPRVVGLERREHRLLARGQSLVRAASHRRLSAWGRAHRG